MASTHTNGAAVRPAHAVHTGAGAATTSAAPLAGSPAATSNNLTGAKRSALAAKTAQDMGLKPVAHMLTGFGGWKSAGKVIETD